MVDSGKTTLKIRADQLPLSRVHALSLAIARELQAQELGAVTTVELVDYEPFTADSPFHGHSWSQISMDLQRTVELGALVDLLVRAGAPESSHLTYTTKMHMSGCTLSEVALSGQEVANRSFLQR